MPCTVLCSANTRTDVIGAFVLRNKFAFVWNWWLLQQQIMSVNIYDHLQFWVRKSLTKPWLINCIVAVAKHWQVIHAHACIRLRHSHVHVYIFGYVIYDIRTCGASASILGNLNEFDSVISESIKTISLEKKGTVLLGKNMALFETWDFENYPDWGLNLLVVRPVTVNIS